MAKLVLNGKRFGKLLVVSQSLITNNKNTCTYWSCLCDCGTTKIIKGSHLTFGSIISCGCNKEWNITDNIEDVKLYSAKHIYNSGYNDGDLSFDDFVILSQKNCYYCGGNVDISGSIYNYYKSRKKKQGTRVSDFAIDNGDFKYNGLDRIDSNIPHNINNIVVCCIICNRFKLDRTQSEMIENIKSLNIDCIPITINMINNTISNILIDTNKNFRKNLKDQPLKIKLSKRVYNVKGRAKLANMVLELSAIEIATLVMEPCLYCGKISDDIAINGIDRVDSNKDYLINNCISCCRNCNIGKGTLSFDDYKKWIKRIKLYQDNK